MSHFYFYKILPILIGIIFVLVGIGLAVFVIIRFSVSKNNKKKDAIMEPVQFDSNDSEALTSGNITTDCKQTDKSNIVKPSPKIIINKTTEYKPELINEPFLFSDKTPNPRDDERRYLIFTKNTYEELLDFIEWGKGTKKNQVEQGGVLLGRAKQYKKEIYNLVEKSLLADTKGSPAFVEFTPEMWADMQDRLSEINEKQEASNRVFITGWFHTHPNSLPVFMSPTDMRTQRLNFWQEWQASLVLNPHSKKSQAFFGMNVMNGKIVIKSNLRGN